MPNKIPLREWRSLALVIAVLLILTTLPYLIGWARQPDGWFFGGHVVGVADGYSYLGKMRLGVDGRWAFHIFYTHEPHEAAPLTFLPYIVPGQALRLFTDTDSDTLYSAMITTFHLLRVVYGAVLLVVLYRLAAAYFDDAPSRFTVLVVAAVGGGWGWLVFLVGAVPPEWLIPEGFGLQLLYMLPHLALARAALIGGVLALFASRRNRAYAVLAGLLWSLAGMSVPFYLAVIYAVLGIWGLLLWVRARAFPLDAFIRAVIAGGLTLPLFGFYYVAFSTNPVLAQWSAQNLLPAPPPLHYLAAYGGLLAFGAFGVRRLWTRADERGVFVLAWVLAGLTLVYLPINVQRRLGEGTLVALAVLAVTGLNVIVNQYHIPARRLRAALWVWVLPTTALFYLATFGAVLAGSPGLFVPADEVRALTWLDDNAIDRERGAVVLTRFDTGMIVPAYSDLRPYVGHGPETLNATVKEARANAYFDDTLTADERAALYADGTINYVFFGMEDTPPAWADETLAPIYREGAVTIYAVNEP